MRELTAAEMAFIGGGDFWGSLEENMGQIGQEIESIWQSFTNGGPPTAPSPVTQQNIGTLENVCAANGGSWANTNGTVTISGLSELGGGQIQFTGNTMICIMK